MSWLAWVLLVLGGSWLAYRIHTDGDDVFAAALLLVPLPILGLFAWYRTDWDETYRAPAIMYFSGYALALLVALAR